MLEMAIVGYQSRLETISAKIADYSRYQGANRSCRSRQAKGRGNRNGSRQAGEAPHDKQSWPCQECRGTESQVGGAETAASQSGKAQKVEIAGGRFESHQGSRQEAVHGFRIRPDTVVLSRWRMLRAMGFESATGFENALGKRRVGKSRETENAAVVATR